MRPARSDRLGLLLVISVAGIGLLWLRAAQLTVLRHDELHSKARKQQMQFTKIPALRGSILDRGGERIALSVEASSFALDPTRIRQEGCLESLAVALERAGVASAAEVREIVARHPGKQWARLPRTILPEATASALEARFAPALIREPEPKRLYPLGASAGAILGATGAEGDGVTGLEARYEKALRGRDGRLLDFLSGRQKIHGGPGRVVLAEPRIGATVELTIDARLQEIVAARLREEVLAQRAKGGAAILLDPCTGEILALASQPEFDPTNLAEAQEAALKVWAVTENFEPGSTYKIVTFAAALEERAVTPDTRIQCHNGVRRVPGGLIRDHEPSGVIPAWEVLAVSSNIGTGLIAERLGGEGFYRMERLLGFGVPTGVEIPGEERGRILDPSSWSKRSLVTQAFGQEISCTALQAAMAYAAVANGGLIMRPYLVRAVRAPDGTVLEERRPEVVRKAMSPETARTLRMLLRRVVTDGTGTKAEVEGLFVAGKTGTAQKYITEEKIYSNERYIASFVGFAPCDNAKWLCMVVLDEPRGSIWGGSVAAPVFQKILSDVASIEPRSTERPEEPIRWVARKEPTSMVPKLAGLSPGLARELLKQEGLSPRLVGRGSLVVAADPGPGSRCRQGTVVQLVLGEGTDSLAAAASCLPDFTGLSLRDALGRARWFGLPIDARGAGWVLSQNPAPGTPLSEVRRLLLELGTDSCRAWIDLQKRRH